MKCTQPALRGGKSHGSKSLLVCTVDVVLGCPVSISQLRLKIAKWSASYQLGLLRLCRASVNNLFRWP